MNENMELNNLDELVKAASENARNNEDISHLREIQAAKDHYEKDIIEATERYTVKNDGKPDFSHPMANELKETDLPIDQIDKLEEKNNQNAIESVKGSAAGFDLTDDEAENIAKLIILYKNNKRMNVYAEMIPSMKARINKLCFESSIPITEANNVARYMMDQFLSTASEDEEFVDIEKSLEEAMKIPSLIDIYTEHVNENMNIRLPAMAEEIRKTDPEKADLLLKVCDQYNNAFLFSKLRDMYDEKSGLRKSVRKKYQPSDIDTYCRRVNYYNDKTKFKMPDATPILGIVSNLFERDKNIYPSDVAKFTTLLLEAISYLNLDDLLDAAFAYYLLKNVSMLSYVGDKLSDFSAELISNIKITIYYIRIREDEFNERNSSDLSKSGNSNKRKKRNKSK